MTGRAKSFGSAAAAYERYRPGYPDELVDTVLIYAGRPVRTALEIGAGTGKATRAFADRGIAVTATEPDEAMLDELRRHVPASVTTVQATFENLSTTRTYDLVFAAASLHWTAPVGRWPRVAALLATSGTFACFGGQLELSDLDVERAARSAREPYLRDDDIVVPDLRPAGSQLRWPGSELLDCGLFTDVRESTIPQSETVSASDYVGHLSTVSAYLLLPPAVRRVALTRMLEVLPDQVNVTADITLHTARLA
ncbi:class I SAM-dependent methyltransferase [uncultured Jatrophihabitans sp.]|uniref:class I SAM-dependent methyltransferase n=1 Tax=uncultured Jatrophihabitans sp. TaxID=1610747 RepID=UPI0035CBD17A